MRKSTTLKKWIGTVIGREKKREGQLNYIFCSDKELLQINKEFLGHKTLTDIITFDYTEGKTISGEIYISAERVMENAEKFGVSFSHELRRVMIHGVLHLCGYGDKTASEKRIMRAREEVALELFKAG